MRGKFVDGDFSVATGKFQDLWDTDFLRHRGLLSVTLPKTKINESRILSFLKESAHKGA
jgi:hypothetical protein